jgi:hypothetical protein
MSVITLVDYKPVPRYDCKSWSNARVEGAGDEAGPWTLIESFGLLSERDIDPSDPMARNFTVEIDDETVDWVRVVFADTDGKHDATGAVYVKPVAIIVF